MKSTDSTPMDTTPEIDSLYRSLLMRRSGAERLRMGAEMFETARALVTARVRADAPALSDAELRLAVFARVYAGDLDERTISAVAARQGRSS